VRRLTDEVARLDELRQARLLTDDQFETLRAKLFEATSGNVRALDE
jgi:hypothetical protein